MIRATAPHFSDHERTYRQGGAWPEKVVDPVTIAAGLNPDQLALVDRRERFDYAGLDRAIGECAAQLVWDGVREQDSVVLVASNECRSAIAFHALRRIEAVCVLVSDHASPAEISQALVRTQPRLALAPQHLIGQLSDHHPAFRWQSCEEGESQGTSEQFVSLRCAPSAPGVVMFTSGSTSRPKGVVHSTNTLRVAAANYIEAADLKTNDVFFLVSPLSSITGVLQALFMAPMLGGCAILENRWDDADTFDLLLREQATFYGGPDVILRRLLDEADRRELSSVPLRAVSVGGALLDTLLLQRAEKVFGICVMRAYGSSEAPFSTTTPRTAELEHRLEMDGLPNRWVDVRIGSLRDEGECLVRGPHLFMGYLDAEDNSDAFESGWFRTGDAGVLRGGQLKIVGRLKEIVIRNGVKISIPAVEQAALTLSFLEDAAAFGRPDQETGEHLVLAVRPKDGVTLDLAMVTDGLRHNGLATRSLPEELVIWDEPFPRTITEKLSRAALAEKSAGRPCLVVHRLES